MIDKNHIERALQKLLPIHLHTGIPELAQLLAGVANQTMSEDSAASYLQDTSYQPLLQALSGKQLAPDVIHGDITFGDISKGEGIAIGHGASAIVIHLHIRNDTTSSHLSLVQPYHSAETDQHYTLICRVFDRSDGTPISNLDVKVTIDSTPHKITTDSDGAFSIQLSDRHNTIHFTATKYDTKPYKSFYQVFDCTDMLKELKEIHLYLEEEMEIYGELRWCGTELPVSEPKVSIRITGVTTKSVVGYKNGTFQISVPRQVDHRLIISAEGAVEESIDVGQCTKISFPIFLAKRCDKPVHEEVIVHKICSNLDIDLIYIPEGIVWMGDGHSNEEYFVRNYYISRYPITCMQYSFYLQLNPFARLPDSWETRYTSAMQKLHPVSNVSCTEAENFCRWLSSIVDYNYRLPTHQEWVKASRGSRNARIYPWGDKPEDITKFCNCFETRNRDTTSVTQYHLNSSPYNVRDTVGNVWEWTSSELTEKKVKTTDPLSYRVVCGGSYRSYGTETTCLATDLILIDATQEDIGFRIVCEAGG